MTRLDLSLLAAKLRADVTAWLRRRREPDRLLTLPPISRDTWEVEWPEFYVDTAKAAGDRACLERVRIQQARNDKYGNRPKHAFLSVTQEWPQIVGKLRAKSEVAG